MNVQTLATTLQFLIDLDSRLGLQSKLQAVRVALENLAQSSANPTQQSALASALVSFKESAEELGNAISPQYRSRISELGGDRYFKPEMEKEVRDSIAINAMTPSVARDFVQKLTTDREAYLSVLNSALQGIQKLGVRGEPLSAGSAEMAFIVPGHIFKDHLGTFAKELNFLNRLITNVGEALTGEVQPVDLKNLSSSIPTITVAAVLSAMVAIGGFVNKFLDSWKKAEEIREIRNRVKKAGLRKPEMLNSLTEEITTIVEEVVEECTTDVISKSPVEPGRKNELAIAIKRDVFQLFTQLERGLTVEIRVEPPSPADKDKADPNLQELRTLSQTLQFPIITNEPVLVTDGSIDEPDGEVVFKRTSTRRAIKNTTTSKKISMKPEDSDDSDS